MGLGFILLGSFDGVNKGDLISLLSAVCYAIHIVVTGIFAREEEKYAQFGAANYADASRQAVIDMREDIAQALQGRK